MNKFHKLIHRFNMIGIGVYYYHKGFEETDGTFYQKFALVIRVLLWSLEFVFYIK